MRKLSSPQLKLLASLRDHGLITGLDVNNNTTVSWAVRRGLIEWAEDVEPHRWRITPLGLAALAEGKL